jgi:hypothetical protein
MWEEIIRNGRWFLFGPRGLYVDGQFAMTGPYPVYREKAKVLLKRDVDVEALIEEAKGNS